MTMGTTPLMLERCFSLPAPFVAITSSEGAFGVRAANCGKARSNPDQSRIADRVSFLIIDAECAPQRKGGAAVKGRSKGKRGVHLGRSKSDRKSGIKKKCRGSIEKSPAANFEP